MNSKVNFSAIISEDSEIASLTEEEALRQENTLEMIASENFTSDAVRAACGTILTNKYAEGRPSKRYYGGCYVVDKIEQLAIERACALFGAEHANVQPHSGSQANYAAYRALGVMPGDTVLSLELHAGAHLTHGSPVNFSGKTFNMVFYQLDKDGYIDMEDVRAKALECKPKAIVAGTSAYSRVIDYKAFREIADTVGAKLMVDMAHIAGLVAAGLHPNPVPYADVVTTTTHKTLRGPRGGLILCKSEYAKAVDSAVFPYSQGGPLEHIIAAKAICFKEAMTPEFKDYMKNVLLNTKVLAEELKARGFDIVTGGTDVHLALIDLTRKGITGKEMEERLESVGIATNKNSIPNDKLSPNVTSGVRVGAASLTTRGLNTEDMKIIAGIFALVADDYDNKKEECINKVKELCRKYPLYSDLAVRV